MKDSAYLAHISSSGSSQLLLDHLEGTARLAKDFALPFGGEEQAELAGLSHDIGKYSKAFQDRLHGNPMRVDHSTAGAVECWKLQQPFAAFAVAGHHGGLPNGGSRMDPSDKNTLHGRLKKQRDGLLKPYNAWVQELTLPHAEIPDFLKQCNSELEPVFFTRMLYSCLVDADFLDTETFMSGKRRESSAESIDSLWDKLQKNLSGWFPPKGELNTQRCKILSQCIQAGETQAPGLFTLTVPTGGGKTVASLSFALAHAKKHGLKRIIYVIPYTSIIEQTADKFRTILGEENVLEHHSNISYDLQDEATPLTIQLANAAENWDMPVVVTTAVQFFESLYAYRSSQCRKLHNIAESVIVFDEAQMLPIPYLRPCVWAISQLVKNYKASALLCTATQPALDPLFHEFLPECTIREICPAPSFTAEVFQRVTFQKTGRLTWDELAARMNSCRQVLCIVNSRKSAQEVYQRLEVDGTYHLSTLMYPAHRWKQLTEIRERLKQGLPCRVVSTSLIEAGVDVDFRTVFREQAGLDSILQAAGRCNREGKRPAAESFVYIFEGEGKVPLLFSTAIGAGKQVLARYEDISSPEAIHEYFRQLLDLKGKAAQDKERILPLIQSEPFPFRTIAERFHLIDSPTRTIYIPLEEGAKLIGELQSGTVNRNTFRKLGRYSVSIYEQHFAALEQAGDLQILDSGDAVLRNLDLYSMKTGLSLEADYGKALFI